MTKKMRGWHFVGKTLRDGSPVPKDGVWLTGKPAEMVVVAVAQHQGVERARIDAQKLEVVDQGFRRVAVVDERVANLVAAPAPACAESFSQKRRRCHG